VFYLTLPSLIYYFTSTAICFRINQSFMQKF